MYLSTRLDAIKKTLNTLCKTATEEEKSFYESLYDLVSATAQQVDVIGSRLDELEEKTGIDFFHNLPDNIENEVERSYNKSDWGL